MTDTTLSITLHGSEGNVSVKISQSLYSILINYNERNCSQRVPVAEIFKYPGVKFVAKSVLYVDVPSIEKVLCCM